MLEPPGNAVTLAYSDMAFSAAALTVNVMFFVSLIFWTLRARTPFLTGCGFFLSHTLVGLVCLPFILSVRGEQRWLYSMSLWLIDLPILPLIAYYGEKREVLKLAAGYIVIGGGVYAILGFVVGLIRDFLRRRH